MSPQPDILIERARQRARSHGQSQVCPAHVAEVLVQELGQVAPMIEEKIAELLAAVPRDYQTVSVHESLRSFVRSHWHQDALTMIGQLLHIEVSVPEQRDESQSNPDQSELPFTSPTPTDNVAPEIVAGADSPAPHTRVHYATLTEKLKARVRGQDEAVEHVVARLAVFQRQLDARPERPDGVFLFAGPTGVGKTELAKSIAEFVFADPAALLRIDMSEYTHPSDVTRLVGPGPGFLGHDEPSSWLTSRVIKQPRCVLLLDEVEKAHPTVWNTFLQIFDAGRLTDGRGKVADFSQIVIIMTTNVGAEVYADKAPIGLLESATPATETSQVLRELKQVFRPELLNRIDEIVLFKPLTQEIVRAIARMHVEDALQRLQRSGYGINGAEDLPDFIAAVGYDRQYGARPILRAIDEHVMAPLAILDPGTYSAKVDGRSLVWIPLASNSTVSECP